MKILKFISIACISAMTMTAMVACGSDDPELVSGNTGNTGGSTDPGTGGTETPPAQTVEKTPTLLITEGWVSDTVAPGLVYHNFEQKFDDVSKAMQIVNVLELDLTNPDYTLNLRYISNNSSCSDAVKGSKGIAGINAGYELEAIYVKVNGVEVGPMKLQPGHLRYWKHEGAFCWTSLSDIGQLFGGKDGANAVSAYKADKRRNIISSAPVLIDNYDPCGARFAGDYTDAQLNQMEYEDYRRHQGVRHPRTAIAITEDKDLLLITVDGRWSGRSEGMSAKELTNFLVKYFNPIDALNLDGGGSTTMVVKGHGDPTTNVVNYPTDNNVFDHTGERKRDTHIVIVKK